MRPEDVVVGVAGDPGTTATTTVERGAPQATRVADRPSGTLSAEQVYEQANRSVVFISARVEQESDSIFGGGGGEGEATGTGFVTSEEGLIVTTAHVVEGATAIEVKVGDGESHPATVVGRDPSTDLVLLRVDAAGEDLQPQLRGRRALRPSRRRPPPFVRPCGTRKPVPPTSGPSA